jgi:hypothetical protein
VVALQAAKHCVVVASKAVFGAAVSAPPPQPAANPAISASSTPLLLFSMLFSYYFLNVCVKRSEDATAKIGSQVVLQG